MIDHLRDLMAYCDWANAVFFQAWAKSPARDNDQMRQRVAHLVGVQEGFLSLLNHQAAAGPPNTGPATFDELKARAQASHQALNAFAQSLDAARTADKVPIPWFPAENPCILSAGEALVQVALHAQHHRGQLMTRLKDFGGEPKNVDWIIWLWKGRPEPRWD